MNILVCIKQLEKTQEMNRFDAYALEEALLLIEHAEKDNSHFLDVITTGSASSEKTLRRALGLGADRAYHLVTDDQGLTSCFVTASRLAAWARGKHYDLILTGVMSTDTMAGQTGPLLAELLELPCATGVIKVDANSSHKIIDVERELEHGVREVLQIQLPALLTIQAGINTPRYPRLSKMLEANRKVIVSLKESDLTEYPFLHREKITGYETPEKSRAGRVFEGTTTQKAEQLLAFLKEKDLL
jgi:electron transfer flavoprotein beta subunit